MKKLMTTSTIVAFSLLAVATFAQNQNEETIESYESKLADRYQVVANLTTEEQTNLLNPRIDGEGYILESMKAIEHRDSRRVSEGQFIEMSQKDGVVILDTRSRLAYDMLHVEGSINLPYPDMAYETLNAIFPNKDQIILIYCNNNFSGGGMVIPAKTAIGALNTSTYGQLYSYGYRNIYELGEYLPLNDTEIKMAGAAMDNPKLMEQGPKIYAKVGSMNYEQWQSINPGKVLPFSYEDPFWPSIRVGKVNLNTDTEIQKNEQTQGSDSNIESTKE